MIIPDAFQNMLASQWVLLVVVLAAALACLASVALVVFLRPLGDLIRLKMFSDDEDNEKTRLGDLIPLALLLVLKLWDAVSSEWQYRAVSLLMWVGDVIVGTHCITERVTAYGRAMFPPDEGEGNGD